MIYSQPKGYNIQPIKFDRSKEVEPEFKEPSEAISEPVEEEIEVVEEEVSETTEVEEEVESDEDGERSMGEFADAPTAEELAELFPHASIGEFGDRPQRPMPSGHSSHRETIDLRHAEQEIREYYWEKPDWINSHLRPTEKGKLLKEHGDLSNPVTHAALLVESGVVEWVKPEWAKNTTAMLKKTNKLKQIKKEAKRAEKAFKKERSLRSVKSIEKQQQQGSVKSLEASTKSLEASAKSLQASTASLEPNTDASVTSPPVTVERMGEENLVDSNAQE
jgi:hypothetical protein